MVGSTPGKELGEENSKQREPQGQKSWGRNEFGLFKEWKGKSQRKPAMKIELNRQREEWHETRSENNLKNEGLSLGHHGNAAVSEGHGGAQLGEQTLGSARLAQVPLPTIPK